jgi:transmembrane sensor
VKYDDNVRRVELAKGEALFNVAKRPEWPFVVVAGERQVTALGTSFVVRRDEARVAVTLVEGKVVVAPSSESSEPSSLVDSSVPGKGGESGGAGTGSAGASPRTSAIEASGAAQPPAEVFTLAPGQRLTFTPGEATQLDTPPVETATAWRRGQVILDDTPLSAAATEMNRYNSIKLVIEQPETGALVVNGLFQAGDSIHFANAVAQTYGLQVIERGDEIVLAGRPIP